MSSFTHLSAVPTEPTTPSRPLIRVIEQNSQQCPDANSVSRPRIAVLDKPTTTPVTPVAPATVRRLRPVRLYQAKTRTSAQCLEASEIETATDYGANPDPGVVPDAPATPSDISRSIRKKLFLEDRPSKRLCQSRKPTISIRGQSQRTQPAFPRAPVSYIVSRFDTLVERALSSCSAFRTFVASPNAPVDRASLKQSLLLSVERHVENFFLARLLVDPIGERHRTVAVFALASMIHDDRSNPTLIQPASFDNSNLMLFIPQPWCTSNPDWLQSLAVDALITPFRVCLMEQNQISREAIDLISNTASFSLQSGQGRMRLRENNDGPDRDLFQFTHISPHDIHISIRVHVIFVIEVAFLAIVQDTTEGLAIFRYSQQNPIQIGELSLQTVKVAPRGIYTQTVLTLIAANCDRPNRNVLEMLRGADEKILVLTQELAERTDVL